jgi:hypothetical protein
MQPDLVFKNFSPRETTKALCEKWYRHIYQLSPREAVVNLQVARLDNGNYECEFEVRSEAGSFMGKAENETDEEAIKKAAQYLIDSLQLWKDRRVKNMLERAS